MAVAGASLYLNQATAQIKGLSLGVNPNIFGAEGGISAVSLLDVGRANAVKGIGLSANARSLNASFLKSTSSVTNSLFSLTGGTDGTVEGGQAAILALRASLPASQVRGEIVDQEA